MHVKDEEEKRFILWQTSLHSKIIYQDASTFHLIAKVLQAYLLLELSSSRLLACLYPMPYYTTLTCFYKVWVHGNRTNTEINV